MCKKIYFVICSIMLFSLFSISTFAKDISLDSINVKTNDSIHNKIAQEIISEYTNIAKIEFIVNNSDLYYFRVFEEKGDMNYKVIEYDGNTSQMKELIWIWSKNYDSDIRTIDLKTSEVGDVNAKVYLRDGMIIDEKVDFIDLSNGFAFVELVSCEQES